MTLSGLDHTELTLELARRSHEPVSADRARNLAALRSRLGLPGSAGGGSLAHGSVPPAQPPLAVAPDRLPRFAPWQQLLAVGAVTGTLGFLLGLGVRESAAVATNAQTAAATNTLQPAPAATNVTEYAKPVQAAAPATPLPVAQPTVAQPTVAQPTVAPPSGTPLSRATKPQKPRRTAARSTAAEPSAPDFLEAVQLLSRSRRALERQEPALALSLLDELDARFSARLLDEERAATRVLALCASGERERALALARSWFSTRPRSIYTPRLEQSCASEALRTSSR
jgi:hypothetical protein